MDDTLLACFGLVALIANTLSVGMPRREKAAAGGARSPRSLVEPGDVVPFTSVTGHVDYAGLAHQSLLQFHATSEPELEQKCYMNRCEFDQAQRLIGNADETTAYWSLLNCVKFGLFCDDQGRWDTWQEWSECAATCGAGQQTRRRKCRQAKYWGPRCDGPYAEMRSCTRTVEKECVPQPAKPDHWGAWRSWSECPVTCGSDGYVSRSRDCLPYHEPYYCLGERVQHRLCVEIPPCPVVGLWSAWMSWSDCLVPTCGRGVRLRSRECSNPSPIGLGKTCVGASSQQQLCPGPPCPENLRKDLAYLTENSLLHYHPHPPSSFLSLFVRFRPMIAEGTLLRYTDRPRGYAPPTKLPSNIIVGTEATKPARPSDSFILVSLATSGHLIVEASLNKSDLVTMEAGKIRIGEWNTLLITAVSDVIIARVNDATNMVASLQDSPNLDTNTGESPDSLWAQIKSGAARALAWLTAGSAVRNTRAILTSYQGKVGLGKVEEDRFGFRGYISDLAINFQNHAVKAAEQTDRNDALNEPAASDDVVAIQADQYHLPGEVALTYFNGKTKLILPFAMKWWSESAPPLALRVTTKASDIIRDDVATLELTLKPHSSDGIILWNRGSSNLAQHMKLSLEDGRTVKFTHDAGGIIKSTQVDDAIKLRHWNTIVLQLERNGEVHLTVNGAKTSTGNFSVITEKNKPSAVLFVGGAEKDLFLDASAGVTARHAQGFHGYIYSVRMDGVEMLAHGHMTVSKERALTSDFVTKPVTWKSWHFKPGVHAKWDASSAEKLNRFRSLSCVVPVPPEAATPPSVSWYKDGFPVSRKTFFRVTEDSGLHQVRSRVYLMPLRDGSRTLSGVYSCVVSKEHSQWLLVNHVISVINHEVIYPGGLAYVINWVSYKLGTSYIGAVIFLLGSLAGTFLVLLLLCGALKRFRAVRKLKAKRERTSRSNKSDDAAEEVPLVGLKVKSKRRTRRRRSGASDQPAPSSRYDGDSSSEALLSDLSEDVETALYDERPFR